jgi:phage terminase small subunit
VALTAKRRRFAEEYLIDFNATQAAIRAGYSPRSAKVTGHNLRHKPEVQEYIERRIEETAMAANEVLLRLAQQARGEAGAYVRMVEVPAGEDRDAPDYLPAVNIEAMRRDGRMHLIKKISEFKGRLEIEFYDAQSALQLIGKHLGMFKDKVEHSGSVGVRNEPVDLTSLSDDELAQLEGILERAESGEDEGDEGPEPGGGEGGEGEAPAP